jgi:hypothetical protein
VLAVVYCLDIRAAERGLTGIARAAPALQDAINGVANSSAGVAAAITPHEQLVVARVIVADGGNDGGGEGVMFERASRGRTAYPAAAASGSVCSDRARLGERAAREQSQDGIRHARGKFAILFSAALFVALAPGGAYIRVLEAFVFSALERSFLDQDALALVAASRSTEPNNHSRKGAVSAGASREGGGAAVQVDEVAEIGTAHAQRPVAFQEQETAFPQFFPALIALRVAKDGENHEVL